MIRRILAGATLALGLATSALASGPLQISTNFPFPLGASEAYQADLASIGVHSGLDNPVTVQPAGSTTLTFKLLESHVLASGYQVLSLDLGGVSYATPLQAFSASGTVLATVTTDQPFSNFVGITDTFGPEPPSFIWGNFTGYLTDADTAALTGIGPFIGDVSTFFFNTGNAALFEVDVGGGGGGVPEPATWSMLVAGFGLMGAALRRRRSALA
jgi:hypothetical protein